jgi:outer membrane cobalamin receptor
MVRLRARGRSLAAILFCSLLSAAHAQVHAQGTTISVNGVVRDISGATVSGASVDTIVSGQVHSSATSDSAGRYQVNVPAGVPFEIRVRRSGFANFADEINGTSAEVQKDVTLQVGRASDTLVVTAARRSEVRPAVTASVSVGTPDDLHALGASQVTDFLRFVPGLAIEGNGREGTPTSLFSRGGESDYNLVLIDGVRANQQGGFFDFSRIDAAEIDRVEVVRGAQSALWGSDAMGSVVQIFTRRAGATDPPQVSGGFEAGSFDTWRADTRVSGGALQMADYQAGVSHKRTNGAFEDILPQDDWFEQTTIDGSLGVMLGARASLRTGARYAYAQGRSVGPITYGARNVDGSYDTKSLSWFTDVTHTVGTRFSGTGTVNYFRYQQVSADGVLDPPYSTYAVLEGTPNALYPNGVRLVRLVDQAEFEALRNAGAMPGPGQFLAQTTNFSFTSNNGSRLRRPSVRYQGDYTWLDGQRLTAGYEWERESIPLVETNSLATGFGLDNHAVFVQHQSSIGENVFVTIGARLDAKEDYASYVSPKLSVGGFVVPYRAGALSSVKVFGNIGKGIKSPTFGERFGSSFSDGNPDLRVERARTGDIGFEATFSSGITRAAITYFNNEYTDQIAFRSGRVGDGIPELINVDGSEADGWELEVALQRPLRGFTAVANYSLVDTRVVTNLSTSQQFQPGQPLLRRPKHSGSFRAGYTAGAATVHFDLRVVGDRHDNSFLFMRTIPNAQYPTAFTTDITVNPGYTVAGLGLDYRLDRSVTLFVRSNNIGDTEYDSALGYPGMPRTVMVGANVRLAR